MLLGNKETRSMALRSFSQVKKIYNDFGPVKRLYIQQACVLHIKVLKNLSTCSAPVYISFSSKYTHKWIAANKGYKCHINTYRTLTS